jgi:formylglycine-generating enzyme required for sulfatase activity
LDPALIRETDQLEGILDQFLKTQLQELEPTFGGKAPLEALVAMISDRYTKLQVSQPELQAELDRRGVELSQPLESLMKAFEERKIVRPLRSGSEVEYEISHDVLALVVGRNQTEEMKLREEAEKIYSVYASRTGLFSREDIDHIRPYQRYKAYPGNLQRRIEESEASLDAEEKRIREEKDQELLREKERAEKEIGLRKEAEAERRKADVQREIAESAKRRATWFARGAGALALVGVALALFAWNQTRVAKAAQDTAEAQRLIADSSATVAQKQTVLAKQKTKEAEENLVKAQKEEKRALTALQQIQKEKAATEEQRRKAEDNYRIAQTKTQEAEASAAKARQALAETQVALEEVVRRTLVEVDRLVYQLKHEEAHEQLRGIQSLGVSRSLVSNALLEFAFWYGETGDLSRAWGILDTVYGLAGRRLDVGMGKDLESLRSALRDLDGERYVFLQSRYFPDMVAIKGGDFTMGGENGEDDEKPPHRVSVSDFEMSKHEVTWWQYGMYATAERERGVDLPEAPGWGISGDNPVVNVSWYDAVGYGNWLSGRSGLDGVYKGLGTDDVEWESGKRPGYRLPTEAEWEYAARGGNQQEWAGTNAEDSLGDYGWYDGNSRSRTRPVGGKKANPFGLYDMSGNVWEWCWDWYDGYGEAAESNPRGPSEGTHRVLRGGSWSFNAEFCRSAYRGYSNSPADRDAYVGFRLVFVP